MVCGLIFKDDKVFVCRRLPHKSFGGYWEFPGGKVESNETEESCLLRELKEELDMNVEVISYFHTSEYQTKDLMISLSGFLCRFLESSYSLTDHDAYKWIKPADLTTIRLAPADMEIARRIMVLSKG